MDFLTILILVVILYKGDSSFSISLMLWGIPLYKDGRFPENKLSGRNKVEAFIVLFLIKGFFLFWGKSPKFFNIIPTFI